MWPLRVIFRAPGRDLGSRIEQIPEPAHVQTLISKPAIEAFDVRVLRRLAWLDVNRIDPLLDAPRQEVPRADLGPIITSDRHGRATPVDNLLKRARHAAARHGRIHVQRQAFTRIAIDHGEDPQPASAGGDIADKVDRPLLIRRRQHRSRPQCAFEPFAASSLDAQYQIAIHPQTRL